MYPNYTYGERVADGCIHVVGVIAGMVAVTALMLYAAPSLPAHATVSLAVYGVAMLAMFGFSAAYHLVPLADWKNMLRRCDQAAIFLKIAGTYTPFALVTASGVWGYALLAVVWLIALGGAFAKLMLTVRWDRLSLVLYLTMGWASIIAMAPLLASFPMTTIILLFAGGVVYSVGVIFFLWWTLPYNNAIWHAFVLAGTGCHFAAVATAAFATAA